MHRSVIDMLEPALMFTIQRRRLGCKSSCGVATTSSRAVRRGLCKWWTCQHAGC